MNQERVAAVALERHSGNTLLILFFWAGRGRGKRLLRRSVPDV